MQRLSVILLAVFLCALLFGCGQSKHRPIDVYFTVESEYGSPNPPRGENYLNYGLTITTSVDSLIEGLPGIRYVCAGWTGSGSVPTTGATNSCQFTITENSAITWTWQTQYELTIQILPEGSGTIMRTPNAIWYDSGEVVQLNAIANAGYAFTNWTGDLSGSSNPETLVMEEPRSIIGNFQACFWAKTYGGAGDDRVSLIQQTSDRGYIVTGYTYSFGAGSNDSWALKLASDGTVSWQKAYGRGSYDYSNSIQQTTDGGYIMAGHSYGNLWVLKLDSNGEISWQKSYGGDDDDRAHSIQQTSDGGYIVAGRTGSFGASGILDAWVVKLNSDSAVSWQKKYGGTKWDWINSIQQTSDGGYIAAGETWSFGSGDYSDIWVLKLNGDGTVAWQKMYGGTYSDAAYSVQQTSDGGYILAGHTASFAGGSGDFWVLKLASDGTIVWQKAYGGGSYDGANSIQQTSDGGYIVAGYTWSFGAGAVDFWVLKLASDGTIAWQKAYGGTGNERACSIQQTRDGRYIAAGYTDSFGAGSNDFWVLKLASDGTVVFNLSGGAQMTDTNTVPAGTGAGVTNTTATAANTSGTVTNTNATSVDTDAVIMQQAP